MRCFLLPARRAALALILAVAPAVGVQADQQSELLAAQQNYAAARAAEKAAGEKSEQAEQALSAAVARITEAAVAELARVDGIERRRQAAQRELMALLERRAEIDLDVARVRDLAAEAARAYDQALPVYLLIGRTQQLADYPEWKAIERRASETARAAQQARDNARPGLEAVDREIAEKQRQILAIEAEFAAPLAGPGDAAMRGWLEAGIVAGRTRRDLADAQQALAEAFDRYVAKLEPARPPFLEAVSADVGLRTIYRGVWRTKRETEQGMAARIAELRAARDELDASIFEREREADRLRQQRLEIAEGMHAAALRYVDAEERRVDAQIKKIAFTALAEIGGTIVEAALTGGAATALRKAAEATEEKVAEMAAQKLLRSSAPLTEEASEAAARLARRSEEAFARQVRSAYAEAERLAVEAAAARVQRTGEALDVATIDARRHLAQALKGLADSDPAIRAEAQRLAIRLFGEKAVIVLEPLAQAGLGKPGGGVLADLLHSQGPGGDPVARLSADDAVAGSSNVAADVTSVVMGDLYEQGIARGVSYAISVAPDAARAGVTAMREAAVANASRWRQIASGSREFIKGGVNWGNFKDAMQGTARANLIGLATTSAKALITAYYSAEESAAGRLAFELYARMTVDQELFNKLREGGQVLDDDLREARRVRAEIATYLALLGGPRELDITDDSDGIDPDGDIAILLRFSVPIDRAPRGSLAGVALTFKAEGGGSEGAALWRAVLPRRQVPADAPSAQLVVGLADGTLPFARLDADPATPARPDPRAPPTAVGSAIELKWIDLDAGDDRHHKIVLRDPWSGIWTRGATRLRLTRQDSYLTGVVETAGEPGRSERGFAAGERVMRGTVGADRIAYLELLARYDAAWRQKCPAAAQGYWSPGRYTLDPAGVLAGEWEDRQLDESCAVAETVKRQDTLRREAAR